MYVCMNVCMCVLHACIYVFMYAFCAYVRMYICMLVFTEGNFVLGWGVLSGRFMSGGFVRFPVQFPRSVCAASSK